jgi:uncharacterized membrane protein YphA (DoxX/SURF4 family)
MNGNGVESKRRVEYGLTVLRVIVGLVFVMHGAQKLFIYGLGGVAEASLRQAFLCRESRPPWCR